MYVPYLAINIFDFNTAAKKEVIPLKGFLIGNGVFVMNDTMIGTYNDNQYVTH